MPKTQVDRNRAQDNSRLFVMAFLRYFLRICRSELRVFRGDMEMAIIAQAVAITNAEAMLRDPALKDQFRSMSTVIGVERQRGANTMSIAETTGLPRETVRRKLQRLVELDIITRREGGDYVMQPRRIQSEGGHGFYDGLEAETLRFFNTCLEDGVFEVRKPNADQAGHPMGPTLVTSDEGKIRQVK